MLPAHVGNRELAKLVLALPSLICSRGLQMTAAVST
jgi:hypothetical protein